MQYAGESACAQCGAGKRANAIFITVDADTALDKNAICRIMQRITSSGAACVAGNLLVKDAVTFTQKMQIYDYLISIAAVKRFQGSYASTLVAQGAFSAYETRAVRGVGGATLFGARARHCIDLYAFTARPLFTI